MRRATLLVTVGVSVLALLALVVGAAIANTPSGVSATPVTATQITRATLGKFEAESKGIEVESGRRSADLAIVKVVLEPGGSTGWHHHPGVVLVPVRARLVTSPKKTASVTRASTRRARASLKVTAKCILCATRATLRRCSTQRSSSRARRPPKGSRSPTHSQRSVTNSKAIM